MAVRESRVGNDADARRYGGLVRQYLDLREKHAGVILLFRVGSFYEILFEDAELIAGVLGLKLGERPSGGTSGPVPQCGFTYQALDSFLPRLLSQGYRVAVCEEEATERSGVRERSVVRTLTPGTVTDPRLLHEDRPNYLVAVIPHETLSTGLAWTDLSAGEFRAGEFEPDDAAAEITRLDPAELLLPRDATIPEGLVQSRVVTRVEMQPAGLDRLRQTYPETSLAGLPQAESAAELILAYLDQTQATVGEEALEQPQLSTASEVVRLDVSTQRHLEIVETEHGHAREGSLLGTLDRTATPMGQRMLRDWLLRPLTDLKKIAARHRILGELVGDDAVRKALTERLQSMSDLERLATRASHQRTSVDDLRALAAVGAALPRLAETVRGCSSTFLRALGNPRPLLATFAAQAARMLAPQDAAHPIMPAAEPELAHALRELEIAAAWEEEYLAGIRRATGITRLKLERSGTQGLFLEAPVNTSVPGTWIRRGGLKNVERYTTIELDEHAARLTEAEAGVAAITARLLTVLRASAADASAEARDLAKRLAAADALQAMATVASERHWVAPVVDASRALTIEAGRHPVVESSISSFQPNDTHLVADAGIDQVVVLTGPNMAGKSTWMRQTALIVLLAQAGSYVPARSARIGLVDAIFTRIGAVDDLSTGRSTFMVEMLETASVLHRATSNSLVILDEIGRGTSTHDGMAIAWAVVEYLARGPIRPRTIAATHYHELAALHDVYPQIALRRAVVEEHADRITFPHRIEPGAADRSFGIEVARLANLPAEVLARARQVADAIEPLSGEIAARLGGVGRD